MFKFNRENYETALKDANVKENQLLMNEVEQVKRFVEKALTLCLESTSNVARTTYPGIDC